MTFLRILLLMTLSLAACRSDEERAREVIMNFVESQETLHAPVRAYTFLATTDQESVPVDAYSKAFPPTKNYEGGVVSIVSVKPAGSGFDVRVRVENAAKDALVEHQYLVIREPDRFRVKLGLPERKTILEQVERLQNETDLDEARSQLDELMSRAPTYSRPQPILEALERFDVQLQEKERVATLQKNVDKLRALNGEELRHALVEIKPSIRSTDEAIRRQWEELHSLWKIAQSATYLQALEPPRFKVRRITRDGNLQREALVWITNNTGVLLSELEVEITYLNETDGEPMSAVKHQTLKDSQFAPDEEREFVFSLDPGPEGWKGRIISVVVTSLNFVEKS